MARPTPLLRRLASLLAPHAGRLAVGFLLLAGGAALATVGPLLLKRAVDTDIAGGDLGGLALTCLAFVAVQAVATIVKYQERVVLERVGQAVIGSLRLSLFSHLLEVPIGFHDEHPPGALISRVESDTEQMRQLFTTGVVVVVGSVLFFAAMFTVMALHDLYLTAVAAVLVPALLLAVVWLHKTTAPLYLEVRRKTADLTARLTEWIQGAAILQALRQEDDACRRLEAANVDRFESQFEVEKRQVLFWNTISFLELLGTAAVLGVGGWRVLEGAATVGVVLMFVDFLRRSFEPIIQLAIQLRGVQQGTAGARMVFELLDEPTEPPVADPAEWNGLTEAIRFDDVWFAYSDEEWVLREVSFTLPRGEHWALVGVTGGGKSTLASLLLRFHDPTRGRIEVDGVDLCRIAHDRIRAAIGFVPQDLYLFPGTVLDNLRLGEGTSDERVRAAVAELGLDDFVAGLPDGYQTVVAERGLNLSAGERQLLQAVRSLVADRDLLILDEATSAVDPRTERRLQAALHRLREGRTTLTIAHRLATILESDRILVLDGGRILEAGSHDDLLAAGGHYARLFRLQFQPTAR